MPHDIHLQAQEEAAEADTWDQTLLDAAVLIARTPTGISDEEAIQQAKRIATERQAAEAAGNVQCDDEGFVIDFLETKLAYPSQATTNSPKVITNLERLKEQFPMP